MAAIASGAGETQKAKHASKQSSKAQEHEHDDTKKAEEITN